jgi:hypothetical protein
MTSCGGAIRSEIPEDGFTDTVELTDGSIKFRQLVSSGCFDSADDLTDGVWDYDYITEYLGSDIPGKLTKSLDFLSNSPLNKGDTLDVSLHSDGTLYRGITFTWELPDDYMADLGGGFDCLLTLYVNRDNPVSYTYSGDISDQELAPESEYKGVEIITAYQYDNFSFDETGSQTVNMHYIAQFTMGGVNYALVSDNLKEQYFVEALVKLVEICGK